MFFCEREVLRLSKNKPIKNNITTDRIPRRELLKVYVTDPTRIGPNKAADFPITL